MGTCFDAAEGWLLLLLLLLAADTERVLIVKPIDARLTAS